ncbi:MAG: SDR family oxidoreductase [Chitinophagaceae bacterium]
MSYAIVTGASKGIGRAISISLAKRNCDLILVARSKDLLEQLAAELRNSYKIKCACFALDLSLPDAPDKLLLWCQQNSLTVSILVNNAGYGLAGIFETHTWAKHKELMTVNMNMPVQMIHAFLPMLKEQQQSYILNIVSTTAYQALPKLALYAAAKSFLLSFSRALQFELKKTSVSVTAVSPGSTDTDFAKRAEMGPKASKNAAKFNMTPEAVAEIAVKAMFAKKVEVITGLSNKLGAFMAWLLPKRFIESTAAGFYD